MKQRSWAWQPDETLAFCHRLTAPSGCDGQAQLENLCYAGSTESGQTWADPSCICRAERRRNITSLAFRWA